MKKLILFVLVICLAIIFLNGMTFAEEDEKSSWYIGFGIGMGELKLDGETLDDSEYNVDGTGYSEHSEDEIAAIFSFGRIINPKLHIGLDISTIMQEVNTDWISYSSWGPGRIFNDYAIEFYQIYNLFGVLSYYPLSNGVFIKLGGGISVLKYEYNSKVWWKDDQTETFDGTGYLIGMGYDFRMTKKFNLGVHIEYSKQHYSDSDASDDTDFTAVYLNFSWY